MPTIGSQALARNRSIASRSPSGTATVAGRSVPVLRKVDGLVLGTPGDPETRTQELVSRGLRPAALLRVVDEIDVVQRLVDQPVRADVLDRDVESARVPDEGRIGAVEPRAEVGVPGRLAERLAGVGPDPGSPQEVVRHVGRLDEAPERGDERRRGKLVVVEPENPVARREARDPLPLAFDRRRELEQRHRVGELLERPEPALAGPVVDRDDELVDDGSDRAQQLDRPLGRVPGDDDRRKGAHRMEGSSDG